MIVPRNFIVTGEPKGKGRPRAAVFGKHARMYTPEETMVYENHVAQCYLATFANEAPYKGAVNITIHAEFPYPKSAYWPINKKHNGELRDEWVFMPHTKKPDADNVLKAILDGLSKANAWRDDSQVWKVTMIKSYSEAPSVLVCMEGEL